jgi:ribosomal subunit interface protein
MGLRVSGKHMDIGDAFRVRIEDRMNEALAKYFDRGADGHVTVEKSGARFTTDCMLHLDSGIVLQATGEAQEPQASFDAAAERIEKSLRRYKRRLKSHKSDEAAARVEEYAYRVSRPCPKMPKKTYRTTMRRSSSLKRRCSSPQCLCLRRFCNWTCRTTRYMCSAMQAAETSISSTAVPTETLAG